MPPPKPTPREPRPFRFPLFRVGLLVLIGSLFASVIYFYIGLSQSLSSMTGDAPSTEPRDLARYFLHNFLFSGTIPGILFWLGVALMLAGILRGLRRR